MAAVDGDDAAGRVLLVHQVDAGRSKPIPVMRSVEEKLEHVAAGRGISVIPLSVATFYQRADVVAVPVSDLALNKVALAWTASRRSRLIYDFANLALTVAWTPARSGADS